jgi:hypothetical protein
MDEACRSIRGVLTESSRWHARAGVVQIHRSVNPLYRVLLLDSRRDGLPARAEDAIGSDLGRIGLEVDLDAVSDPHGMLRVLDQHPEALDGYDAVVAVAPLRSDWGGSSRTLSQVLEQVRRRMPTLLVEHHVKSAEQRERPVRAFPAGGRIATLLVATGADPVATARRIGAALRVLLDPPLPAPEVDALPLAAARLRKDIGVATIDRLEQITTFARDFFGLAVAEVSLVRGDSIVTVVSAGALPRIHAADDSLCDIALRNSGITVMADTWLDPEACRRTPTHEPDAVRFYAACPLRSSTGEAIGMLCIWDFDTHDPAGLDSAFLSDLALLTEGELLTA